MTLNEKKIKVLRIVRSDIESMKYDFICHSLDSIRSDELSATSKRLKKYIEDQLGGAVSLWTWLRTNSYVKGHQYQNSCARQRITRLAWIDWMINQLETP